jgi:hypothetical protein
MLYIIITMQGDRIVASGDTLMLYESALEACKLLDAKYPGYTHVPQEYEGDDQ